MSDEALVSVVIPTHYRNDWLPGAIESVFDQTYDPIEVIVVDDSGEEHARTVVESYDVTYLPHDENRGGNPARNTGIERADGEYVQLLDDDDRLLPEKVARQVELLKSSSNVGVSYTGLVRGERAVYPRQGVRGDVLKDALLDEMGACVTSTMLIDASILRSVHPLKAREGADDTGLKIELAQRTEFAYIDEPLVRKGKPDGQRSQRLVVAEEHKRIHNEYEHLFDRFPPRVRDRARANRLRHRGNLRLSERVWSLTSIRDFLSAARAAPGFDVKSLGFTVAALFGRPGRNFLRWLYHTCDSLLSRVRSVKGQTTTSSTDRVRTEIERGSSEIIDE
jgi:glycosyltransferase involved in cell wall biosynthesis